MVRRVAGNYFLFPKREKYNSKMPVYLNETGHFIYEELLSGCTPEMIAEKISNIYEIDYETALSDVLFYRKRLLDYM